MSMMSWMSWMSMMSMMSWMPWMSWGVFNFLEPCSPKSDEAAPSPPNAVPSQGRDREGSGTRHRGVHQFAGHARNSPRPPHHDRRTAQHTRGKSGSRDRPALPEGSDKGLV